MTMVRIFVVFLTLCAVNYIDIVGGYLVGAGCKLFL